MFRVSLRQLFALVACCALALASLKLASNAWLMAVLAVAILAMCTAIIFIAADRSHRQAFSLAFALIVMAYGWIVVNLPKHMPNPQFGGNEFELWGGQLPTTRLLRHAYASVVHDRWINSSTGLEIPNFDPSNPSIPLGTGGGNAGGGGGFGGGQGGMAPTPAGPVAIHDVTPHSEDFARIGHLWWALLFGYIGGRIASRVYKRRAATEK